ncbi:breast cancer type 2 susceptibility protein isoform 2-T3 [Spinachia spinachia]
MDFPCENMYDTYKDEIWRELGPLDPDWFETLTSQMFTEDNASDQDDLCGNQEANFKTPFDKTAVDSQLLSTPKVFRHRRVVSPETEDEQSFTEKEALPWTTTQSPYLFKMSTVEIQSAKYGSFLPQSQDRFDLLGTPQKSPVTYDKQISESLGLQLHPDISWTSSLNTPSAIPSTLILSENNDSPSQVRSPEDKHVIFVRKLFPSLSNASRVGRVSPKNNDVTAFPQGAVSPEAGQNPESHDSPPGSLKQSDLDWKQTLPDAIEDGEIRRTVTSVLEGAENVLSIFFTNGSSALRKVKTERIKRKHIIPITEDGCISSDVSSPSNAVPCKQRTADQEPDRPPSLPQVQTVASGITQWSPLSLSDLPPCTLHTSLNDSSLAIQVESNVSTEQLQRDADTGRLVVRTPLKHTVTGLSKKKRQFVYTVETPKLQVPGKEKQCQRMDSSPAAPHPGQEVDVKRSKAPDEAHFCSIGMNEMPKRGNLVDPTPRSPVPAKVHDLDMSQLCEEFVQDFSQMSDHCQLSKVQGDTPGTSFSPSACLSALKRAKQKTPRHDPRGVGDTRLVSTAHHNKPTNDGTIGDSGFQSGARGGAPPCVFPSSEIGGLQRADKQSSRLVTSSNNGEAHSDDILQVAESDAKKFIGVLGPGRQRALHVESTSAQRPSSAKEAVEINHFSSLNGHAGGSLPEETASLLSVHPSGFQTASNESVRITSSNLERAKRLFEEAEGGRPSRDSKDEMSVRPDSVKNPTAKSNQPLSSSEANKNVACQLTASQKADVTELCILLEQADTQFEFTQFKTEKSKINGQANATSPLEVDNELDPHFLSGIDFDDSFNSEVEKHRAVTVVPDEMVSISHVPTNRETSEVTSTSTRLLLSSALKKGKNPSPEAASTSSKDLAGGSCRVLSAEPKHLDEAIERSKLLNGNPLMLGAGFKTAGGNVLRLSKESLTKARALFADFEAHPVTSQTSQDKQSSEIDAKRSVNKPTGNLRRREDDSTLTDCGHGAEGRVCGSFFNKDDKQVPVIKDDGSAKPLTNGTMDTTALQSGLQAARGKETCFSAEAKREPRVLLRDGDGTDSNADASVKRKKSTEGFPTHAPQEETRPSSKVRGMKVNKEPVGEFEDTNAAPAASHSAVEQHTEGIDNLGCRGKTFNHLQVSSPTSGGFQTASGKAVAISSAALKKAKSLLSECVEVEDKVFVKPTHSKIPIPAPGFLAASGKQVAFSCEALQKAKALFSDIGSTEKISAAPEATSADETPAENTEQRHCAFTNIGSAKVPERSLLEAKHRLTEFDDAAISASAMREADVFFKDCGVMDGNVGLAGEGEQRKAPLCGSGGEKKAVKKCKEDQKLETNISVDFGRGHAEFDHLNMGPVEKHEKMPHPDNWENHREVFENLLDFSNAAALHENSSLRIKSLSPRLCTTSKNGSYSGMKELSKGGGFCTASGKNVSLSDDAMRKARCLLNGGATVQDASKQLKQKENAASQQKGGFQTASGKAVAISSAALKKAKSLLSECVEVEDKVFVKPTHSKMPIPAPGFLAASGKQVAFSCKALQKAKALFSDIGSTAEISAAPEATSADETRALLSHFADVECHNSNPLSPHALKSDNKRTCNPPTSLDKDLWHAPESSLQDTDHENESPLYQSVPSCIFTKEQGHSSRTREGELAPQVLGTLCDAAVEDVLDYKIKRGSEVKRPPVSSVLKFQSLDLGGSTETQQKLFAQEARDCTKALLEDESLVGQSLSMTLENVPLQENPKSRFRAAEKRSLEQPETPGQPPLKRRLLEEFDRTADGPRSSTLHPEKSCPNVVIKDRRIFKYNVSLHPNITRPRTDGKNFVETRLQNTTPTQQSTPGGSRSAHSKKPAFVPPFLANATTESRNKAMLKDDARTPSTFVPPFKKQRDVVQESSFRPLVEDEEDKLHRVFVSPFNSHTCIAPTKNTQCSNECNDTVALADNKNNKRRNNPNLPVGCGSETSLGEGLLSKCQDAFQNLPNVQLARDMQDMRIRKKKRQTIRPLPGSLFLTKTSGVTRIPLKAAVHGRPPARYTPQQLYSRGVHQHVCEITSETAESFRFNLKQFVKREAFVDGGGVQLADGGWLIPSRDGTAGKGEFYRALCDTPGVDPQLISDGWLDNHYRWVVWKQASMERSFPETMGCLCLTPEQVLLQLKYRYDVEVDHSRRPALRRITERDDTAAKTLVLCVCGVVSRGPSPNKQSFDDTKTPRGADARPGNPSAVVWLTDGWYAVRAQLDEPLTAMLHSGRVAVGGKLIVHGAQLVGSQEACSPLEAPEALTLKICANSSRPARWDARLGFHNDPRPFLLPLSSLYSSGGQVGCVDIIVLRSYPMQWMERKPEGGAVFRSVRAEEKEARRFDGLKQKAMEILFAKIQDEFEKEDQGNDKPQRRRQAISRQYIASLQGGEELCEAVGEEPAHLEAHLSEQQLETLNAYRRCVMEKKQAQLQDRFQRALESAEASDGSCPRREVTPVWRLCVADSRDQRGSVYQLNLWRPSSDLQALLKEGRRYKVYNLTTSDGKKHDRSSNVQLTGTKKTQFQDLQASREWLSTRYQPRVSTCFVDLQNPEFPSLCGEVDLTGFVIQIVDGQGFSPAFYLADGKLNFVKVRCFSSFAQSGLEDLVKPHVLLSLSNLQLRGQSASPTPVVYAGDLTIFSANPKEGHLQESLSQNRNLRQSQENFFLIAEETLSHLVQSSPALDTRTPAFTRATMQDTTASTASPQLVRSRGSFTPINRKPPAANCSTEKDAGSVKRRRALNYLSHIPSPLPLLNLGSVASPCVNKTFNPPRRSGTPSTLKTVQTPAHRAVDSPVEDEWVNDEELAMIDTQALRVGDLLQVHKTV